MHVYGINVCVASCCIIIVHVYCRLHHQNTSEPTYELITQPTPGGVKLDTHSVADVQDSSGDHHYDFI